MQYERRIVDAEKGIVQITTEDERFYSKHVDGKEIWIPSITWICDFLPKSTPFYKWLANHGWDEAQALKEAGGERGTYVHNAVNVLLRGGTIAYNTIVGDRELTTEEYVCVMSAVDWYNEYKPKAIFTEHTVFSPDDRFAGTLDLLCEIKGQDFIVDFKTSSDIWPPHKIQVTAYRMALGIDAKLAIVQLGYRRNKIKKFKMTEINPDEVLFEAAYTIWKSEVSEKTPLQKDMPLELKLDNLTYKGYTKG